MRRIGAVAFYLGGGLYAFGAGGLVFQFWRHLDGVPIMVWVAFSALGFLLSMGSLGVELQALRRSLKNF